MFEQARWPFVAALVCQKTLTELREALAGSGVSQRHSIDAAAWRLISEALTSEASPIAVRQAVAGGDGDAGELLESVTARTPNGQPWFPLLSGPKISVMWIRMLAEPGRATISNLSVLPIAVDVQVRKATEYLGVTDTGGLELERARAVIQEAWAPLAAAAVGPEPLRGTGAALDPALWFLGKWGCSFCERAGRKLPVSRACAGCRFPNRGTEGP